MIKTALEVLNAPRHRQTFPVEQLKNDRLELSFVPGFGCHWIRLRLLVKGEWVDFLRPVPDGDMLLDGKGGHGSYALAPWSNRIAGAAFQFEGRRHELRKNFRDGTAIHGDVRTRPWKTVSSAPERFEAELDSREFEDFNFPFKLRFRMALALEDDRLRTEFAIENVDGRAAPAGFGFHPFVLRRLTWRDDDLILVVPAERVYPAVNCLPTGPALPVGGATDLRGLHPLGVPNLDHCYTDFSSREIRIIYRGSRTEVRFTFDEAFGHAVIYTPNARSGLPESFVAVEPVTNANDGFNLMARGIEGTGVKVLAPGESLRGGWEISMGDI